MKLWVIFLGVTLLVLGASVTHGCRDVPAGKIDQDWFHRVEKDGGWDQPLGSKFEPMKSSSGMDFDFSGAGVGSGVRQPKGKNRKCFKTNVRVATMPNEQSLAMDCRYDKFNEPSCIFNAEDNHMMKNFLKFNGDFVFTKSDDENYAVVFGCVLGKIEYWVAMVPRGKEVTPYKQAILDHVKEVIGMSTDDKDLKSEDDPFVFKSFNAMECKDEGTRKKKPKSPGLGIFGFR